MKKKQTFMLAIVLVLTLALISMTGCSKNKPVTPEPPTPTVTEPTPGEPTDTTPSETPDQTGKENVDGADDKTPSDNETLDNGEDVGDTNDVIEDGEAIMPLEYYDEVPDFIREVTSMLGALKHNNVIDFMGGRAYVDGDENIKYVASGKVQFAVVTRDQDGKVTELTMGEITDRWSFSNNDEVYIIPADAVVNWH